MTEFLTGLVFQGLKLFQGFGFQFDLEELEREFQRDLVSLVREFFQELTKVLKVSETLVLESSVVLCVLDVVLFG